MILQGDEAATYRFVEKWEQRLHFVVRIYYLNDDRQIHSLRRWERRHRPGYDMVVDGVELGATLPSQSPGPRKGTGIAYDRNLGRTIVFGGQN